MAHGSINQADQSERFLARLAKSRAAATERVGGSHAAAVVALEAILRRRGVDLARIGARRTPLLERLGEPRTAREGNSSCTFPAWALAARVVFAISPNSASCERVFALLKHLFQEQQTRSLADLVEASLKLNYNERAVG